MGNQLTADGLNSCYAETKSTYIENIEHVEQRIAQSKEANCRKLYSELKEKWNAYEKEILKAKHLADAPLNTVDDLEVLLLAHSYDIAYAIANNAGCN